ncbi:MAG: fumarylacetoacetate hydrolase family protein [Polyangiaceae bacterium]
MRLATLRDGSRDGALVVVAATANRCTRARAIAPTLQAALDDWPDAEPRLRELASRLERGEVDVEALPNGPELLAPPLPRAYEWIDGSAYLNHVVLVRKARGAEPPGTLTRDPLVYQGGSGVLLGPRDPLVLPGQGFGLDFEGEIAVVLGDVPRETTEASAAPHVRLLMLANDVTYRDLVPPELEKGFGFFVSKPATAFGPFAVTPDELGPAWEGGRARLRLACTYNGAVVGDLETGPEMHFSFFQLMAHVTRTRSLTAGTILGSGTVSNRDPARGISCLAERRAREAIQGVTPLTPYMRAGDVIRLEAFDATGRSVFGAIEQAVVAGGATM